MIDRKTTIEELEKIADYTMRPHEFDIISGAIALLKEQEPVKPRSVTRHGPNSQIQHFCGKCNAILYRKNQKYCIECGTPVKWN